MLFVDDDSPRIKEAVLAGYWTVKTVIELRTQTVGFDVDVFVLDTAGSAPSARKLEKSELSEHNGFIEAAENGLRSVKDVIKGVSDSSQIEAPPTLKPDKN